MKIRDRIVRLDRVKAGSLIPNPKNWRTHPVEQQDALRGVLSEIGYADALLARETPEGLMLVDGHARAEITPDSEVPVLVLDLDEKEADLLLATLDPLAAMAGQNDEALASLLSGIETDNEAVRKMLDELLEGAGQTATKDVDAEARLDEAEELRKKWGVERGQLWKLGAHRLLCGDSTSAEDVARLMGGERASVLWTDPPYGIDMAPASRVRQLDRLVNDALAPDEFSSLLRGFLSRARAVVDGEAFVCCDWRRYSEFQEAMSAEGWKVTNLIVWNKESRAQNLNRFAFVHEFIAYSGPMGPPTIDTNVWTIGREYSDVHLTPKPIELIVRALRGATDGGVLDLFAGSGGTLVAAEQLSRRCYAMEIEPKYVAVALQRWVDATGGTPVLEPEAA